MSDKADVTAEDFFCLRTAVKYGYINIFFRQGLKFFFMSQLFWVVLRNFFFDFKKLLLGANFCVQTSVHYFNELLAIKSVFKLMRMGQIIFNKDAPSEKVLHLAIGNHSII